MMNRDFRKKGTGKAPFAVRKHGKVFTRLSLLLLFLALACTAAGETEFKAQTVGENHGVGTSLALAPVKLYQKWLSPAIGGRCPMHPSCSGYARQAIAKHGAVLGWIMTCDRLMRCGRDEVEFSPSVHDHGASFCHDPVENNDFWLK